MAEPDVPAPGRGLTINTDGCESDDLAFCGGVTVTAGAALPWGELVDLAVTREWVGFETLAGVADTVGDAVTTNPSAFGRSVGDAVAAVRTWDRLDRAHRRFAWVDCEFDDDGSRFSRHTVDDGSARYVVLDASFLLRQGQLTDPIRDPDLAHLVGVDLGQRALLTSVLQATRNRAQGRSSANASFDPDGRKPIASR